MTARVSHCQSLDTLQVPVQQWRSWKTSKTAARDRAFHEPGLCVTFFCAVWAADSSSPQISAIFVGHFNWEIIVSAILRKTSTTNAQINIKILARGIPWLEKGSPQLFPRTQKPCLERYRCLCKKTLLLRQPLPCSPAAETALQPLIRCSES